MQKTKTRGRAKATHRKRRIILASGGVLWNESARDPVLALVRRVKYGDWALPKGKLKRGETFEQAARREVKEETGCSARLAQFVGLVHYTVKSEPKVVLYWNMECTRQPRYQPNEEIAEVVWLSPRVALRRMSYAGDRKILRSAMKLRS